LSANSLATATAELFARDPRDASVLVVDGYGVSLTVARGHLVVSDGIGRHRREHRLSRAQRTVRRVVILGHTGHLSLEAIRWCHDVGIALIHLDTDGKLLAVAGRPGTDDARLRRAQALAYGTDTALEIGRELLNLKMTAQATVLHTQLNAAPQAGAIRNLVEKLARAATVDRTRELEAAAANIYFSAWTASLHVPIIERDRARVPEHWLHFDARRSPLDYGRSPRKAATPVNALLNYAYALGEAETRLAILAVGLDPGLGLIHTDKKARDSLALDLLEPLRPHIDHDVLALLARRKLRQADLHETRDGQCRLLPPLTHDLAELLPGWTRIAGRIAEAAAHRLASSSGKPIALTTPLTGTKAKAAARERVSSRRRRCDPKAPVVAPRGCRVCGTPLTQGARELCSGCWPVTRAALATERARAGNAALAKLRAQGTDPTNTPAVAAKRSLTLSQRKSEQLEWEKQGAPHGWTRQRYVAKVLPAIATLPLSVLAAATGLSISACSRIRSGKLVPHRRHWVTLQTVSAASARVTN